MIESPRNARVKDVRKLAQKSERQETGLFVIEGPQAVREALVSRPELIEELFVTPTPLGEADEDTESEGCLSFPGERFPLRRSERAILRAVDLDGTPFEIEAEGWFARVFQHEFDHLDGVLYTDRLEHEYAKPVAKITRKRGWGVPGVSWTPGVEHLED